MAGSTSTGIVHPDPKEAERQLQPLIKRASSFVIRTDEDYEAAGNGIRKADAFLQGELVGAFAKHAADLAVVHKQAVALRDRFMKGAQDVKRLLSEKRVEYAQKKQRAADAKRLQDEEKLRLQQIEEAKAQAKAIKREDPEAAKAMIERAKTAPAPSLPARPAVPKAEGFVTKTSYGFAIETPELLPAKYWVIDESLVRKEVNSFGMHANIPGVRVWTITKEHTRGAA